MDLTPYVDGLRQELLAAAGPGDADSLALAERMAAAVASATRLAMLDVLTAAADEITRDLVPGSVEVRLRGRNPQFVVTSPAVFEEFDANEEVESHDAIPPEDPPPAPTDGPVGRINFRPPERLKAEIEAAAGRDGMSVNAWLVRVTTAALSARGTPPANKPAGPSRSFLGWVG